MLKISNNIAIKHATEFDLHEIAKMQMNAWQEDFISEPIAPIFKNVFYGALKRRWSKELESNNDILVLVNDMTILGFLIYAISSDEKKPTADLKSIYIIPSMRRNGLGKLLCHALFDNIKNKKIEKVSAWILKENHRGKWFYESLGFQASTEMRFDILKGNETLTEILYYIHF